MLGARAGQFLVQARPLSASLRPGVCAQLGFSEEVPGKQLGRHIGTRETGEFVDSLQQRSVYVHNGRVAEPTPDINTTGFELRPFIAPSVDPLDEAGVRRELYPRVEALVREALGCSRVITFDHTVRDTSDSAAPLNTPRHEKRVAAGPVSRVHADYSWRSGRERVRQLARSPSDTGCALTPAEAEQILAGRFAIVNVWRNARRDGPVRRWPLALCSSKSVEVVDCLPYKMVYEDRIGESLSLRPRDSHQWYFFDQMEPTEAVIFKCYDSGEGTRFVFHAAFEDPETAVDAPPRTSVEFRTLAVWGEGNAATNKGPEDVVSSRPTGDDPIYFFTLPHSNNAARITLWLQLTGLNDAVHTVPLAYKDLRQLEFRNVNPLGKVPALSHPGAGIQLFEADVILRCRPAAGASARAPGGADPC